jgi:hypothetical protein
MENEGATLLVVARLWVPSFRASIVISSQDMGDGGGGSSKSGIIAQSQGTCTECAAVPDVRGGRREGSLPSKAVVEKKKKRQGVIRSDRPGPEWKVAEV